MPAEAPAGGPTTTATLTVHRVDQVHGKSRLLAFAVVEIELDGIPILLQGVQVRCRDGGGLSCDAPCFRGPDGRWLPAVVLPPDLAQALADEVFAAMARAPK